MSTNQKVTTNVVFKYEQKQRLDEFATVLQTIGSKLKEDQKFTFVQGDKSYEINPNSMITAEIKYSTKGDKHSFEIELEWSDSDSDSDAHMEIR